MRLNLASEWQVMTICISLELSLLNFERLDMWCAWIGHSSEKLWPFEYLEGCHWTISSVSIYESPESDIGVKTYDHFNFPRASVVLFRASRYIKRLNRTSVWKVMSIWISLELPLFNFERLDMWHTWIGNLSIKFDHLNFSRASVVQVRTSRYIMRLNRTSLWNVMAIWISRDLPLFNFERLDMWRAWIWHPSEKLWPFEFLESFRFSILSVSIYYAPEFDIRVKSYDHLNFSRASVVQFRASRYIMRLNLTSELKVMTIWISRELPLFNFECLDILCALWHPS